MDVGVTISEAEARAIAEREHADQEETPREQALEWCRLLVGRYAGADELASLEVVDAGPCMDCTRIVDARYQIGTFAICRNDAIARIRARERLEQTSIPGPVPDERAPENLEQWAQAVAGMYSERAVRAALRVWQIDDDTVIETLDLYTDTRAQISEREKVVELLLQQLDTLDGQRCDHCHTRGLVYLVGDDALCRTCTVSAREPVAA